MHDAYGQVTEVKLENPRPFLHYNSSHPAFTYHYRAENT
mgnify:CR=1 FL=1